MKAILITLFCTNLACFATAQKKIPKSGTYTTPDGNYNITINYKDEKLEVVEPNKISEYKPVNGNVYTFTNPTNGIEYGLEVAEETVIYSFKPGTNGYRTKLTFTGSAGPQPVPAAVSTDYKQVAEKYRGKMVSDPDNAQAWAFCAAAAIARSSLNEEGFVEYAKKVVASLKLIATDKSKCPCEDAIPSRIWKETELQ